MESGHSPPADSLPALGTGPLGDTVAGLARVPRATGRALVSGASIGTRATARAATFVIARSRAALASDGAVGQGLVRGRATLERGLQDFRQERQGFAPGGAFWVRGAALMRLGSVDGAEAHYRGGHDTCIERGWFTEAARCLERLAHIEELRERPAAARDHLLEASALASAQPEGVTLALELVERLAVLPAPAADR